MNRESANAGNFGSLQCSLHRVPQERLAYALAVPPPIHCQTRKQHDRRWMPRQPFREALRCFVAANLAHSKRVVTNDGIACQPNIGLGSSRLLVHPRIPQQIPVQLYPSAVEAFYRMIGTELLNPAGRVH
jgi:hypothetical protein